MNDYINVVTSDEFYMCFVMFFGIFLSVWLIKLFINVLVSLINKI